MNIFKNNFVVGITAGLAATVLAPVLIPALKRSSRPLAKTLVKGGILLYDKGREAVAGAGEMMEDVIAEVRAESYEKQAASAEENEDEAAQWSSPAPGGNGSSHLSSIRNGTPPAHAQEGGPV